MNQECLDPIDSRNYDLILNSTRLSIAQSAELIVETLHRVQAPAPVVKAPLPERQVAREE